MYFWNIAKLKHQLIETGLTEKQVFYYILVHIVLMSIFLQIAVSSSTNTELDKWDYIQKIATVLITLFGTIIAFIMNGGDSGIRFAERYFSIGFVASFRFVIMTALIVIPINYFSSFYDNPYNEWQCLEGIQLLNLTLNIAMYAYIIKNIRDVAKVKREKS